jgi:hypothetical protein
LFTKNSFWRIKQSIPHTTEMIHGEYVKMCKDFAPNFDDITTDCCIMTTHRFALPFSPENFWPKITRLSSPYILLSSVSAVDDKTEMPPFRHNWVGRGRIGDGAEHTEHDFQDAFKMTEAMGTMRTCRRGLFRRWWWSVGPKLVFDQMEEPVPEIMNSSGNIPFQFGAAQSKWVNSWWSHSVILLGS